MTLPMKPTRRQTLFGAAALAALPEMSAAQESRAARAAAIARQVMLAPPLQPPALSLAVANSRGIVWAGALEQANLEEGLAATTRHSFRIGSVSKVVTTALAAKLVSRGVLDLDAPIVTWMPDLPMAHHKTTLKQLLTHQGGVRHYLARDLDPTQPGGAIFQREFADNAQILAIFINDPLVFAPGTSLAYSTFGYTLASIVMEKAAGKSFLTLLEEEIARPFALGSLAADGRAREPCDLSRTGSCHRHRQQCAGGAGQCAAAIVRPGGYLRLGLAAGQSGWVCPQLVQAISGWPCRLCDAR